VLKLEKRVDCGEKGEKQRRKTYAERNDVDVFDGEDGFFAFHIIGLDPENHYAC